ncbi:MAG: type 4a pilus biogenesis protein PilO [Ignavibacteriaceae bacterium]
MLIRNKKWKNYMVLSAGFTILVILFEILPGYNNLISMGIELYNRGAEIEKGEKNIVRENNLTLENKQLRQQINSLISNYEENQRISSIISFLDEAAFGKGVDIASIKPGKIVKKDSLWLQPMEVNLDSDYEGLYNFVRHLEKSSKVVLIKELDFIPKAPLNDSLRITANLEVYLNL